MKKEEICVLIDGQEKHLKAVEILRMSGYGWVANSDFCNLQGGDVFYLVYSTDLKSWLYLSYGNIGKTLITLDELESLLLPNYVVKDVHLTIDELKNQAEKLGFDLVEKKREIKVGDFGAFYSVNEEVLLFDFLLEIEDGSFVDSDGNTWQNFRHLTNEEKEQIQNNW